MPRWVRDLLISGAGSALAAWAIAFPLGRFLPGSWPWIAGGTSALALLTTVILFVLLRRPRLEGAEPFLGAPQELIVNLNRLAQESFLQGERFLIDGNHHLSEVEASYNIDGFDGIYSISYRGHNIGTRVSRSIVRMVASDAAVDRRLINLDVISVDGRAKLAWEFVNDRETAFRKPIRIFFLRPLQQGDTFDFRINCRWPGTFGRQDDYVFFPTQHFRAGVDVLIVRVTFKVRPLRYEGVVLRRQRYALALEQPVLEQMGDVWVVSARMERPNHLYAIWFTRGDIPAIAPPE